MANDRRRIRWNIWTETIRSTHGCVRPAQDGRSEQTPQVLPVSVAAGPQHVFGLKESSTLCYHNKARISDGYTLSGVGTNPLLCIVREDGRDYGEFPRRLLNR